MKLRVKSFDDTNFWQGTMSDLAFLLIVFFILTAVFGAPYVMRIINTNQADSEPLKPAELIRVHISPAGTWYMNDRAITPETLSHFLLADHTYRIDVADNRPYQEFIDLLNILHTAGISDFEIATVK